MTLTHFETTIITAKGGSKKIKLTRRISLKHFRIDL